jgi:hypothetical protein
MGELGEPRWAVISERGCEASGLNYDEALKLLRQLVEEKVHATCIITAEAARHIAPAKIGARRSSSRQPAKTHGKA